ncbi:MAG: LysM peptidoglycan-binding domain-containing protein [Chloroflexota bacterium]
MTRTLPILLIALALTGCNFDAEEPTPTAEAIQEEPINPLPQVTETPTQSSTASPTPSPQPTQVAEVRVTTPTATPSVPPSPAPLPTETPGPWEYTIQPGDTLISIISRDPFNYFTQDVIPAIVALNNNMPNADSLPPPGSTILIPRPTVPPTEVNFELTQAVFATQGVSIEMRDGVSLPSFAIVGTYEVQSGDTVVGIAERFAMTLSQLSQINRAINFAGCNFELRSGGENCNPLLQQGQVINVLLPTPTLTLSPTPSGQETVTPTPTYVAPLIVSPIEGASTAGPVTLSWVSTGVLRADEVYLVQVTDVTAGTVWNGTTRQNSLRLPDTLIPASGQPHEIRWSVTTGIATGSGDYMPVGGRSRENTFTWQSR